MKRMIATAMVLSAFGGAAPAQEAVTVQRLLNQEFAVVGVVPSSAGPGLFLQKKDKMFFCVVAETPSSPAVATRYCKPVQ